MRFKRERTSGFPTSSNRASSLHLHWEPPSAPTRRLSAVLEIVEPPSVPHLYFWALQATFSDRGRRIGGAHLGLQWYDRHPRSTAVNWGGYRDGAGELDGDVSTLPSATGNPNTRDFAWVRRREYRLTISGDGDGWWTGAVTDLETGAHTVVRRLHAPGSTELTNAVVWSEVFARCDDPTVTVRWSQLDPAPARLRPTYQSHADGGCANTASMPDGDGWLQRTNYTRTG